ncbi:MAG: hypothetical protein C4530_09205 [Desulfobacteraceae bacterium]|nr:MAG: hypothetical protein C4530_09205 [Desulfobacteraceae bacterium]
MPHYMNPFDFVPLPLQGPWGIPGEVLQDRRLEGYLTYSLKTLTPVHITGKTTKSRSGNFFAVKSFYENYAKKVIPGSSIRGMIASFIEAVTGSDFGALTRGNEKNMPYGKCEGRHVGFLMASPDDPVEDRLKTIEYSYHGQRKRRCLFERNKTLPPGFGRRVIEDAARFLFGYVKEGDGENQGARGGRLMFEDLVIPDTAKFVPRNAWDLDGEAVMGSPNPRANTAWYFTPGEYRVRKTQEGHRVWEVLADKVRGRKFYFHHYPHTCHENYRAWGNWMPGLREYEVESLDANLEIQKGRIYFTDLPESLLLLLVFALDLSPDMGHKLGALKAFGFGSIRIETQDFLYRETTQPFAPLKSRSLEGTIPGELFDPTAFNFLKKILHFPAKKEESDYVFIYPPYNQQRNANNETRGFAVVERVEDSRIPHGNVDRSNCAQVSGSYGPAGHPEPGKSKKITLFFDSYQKSAVNFQKVMGGPDYTHLMT